KGEWYNEKGASNKALLMRTPIDGARISSNYGMRRHPVLGYSKMHRGVDFAAPTGTPIYAAGDGVVTKKYRSRTYGNYIRLRHTGQYSTAYAHLSRFRRGIGVGSSVKQGQVIGYVGNTGRSTGPHLHYEVLKNGKQINPHSKNLPVQKPVSNAKKKLYKKLKAEITRRRSGEMETKTYSSIKDLKGDII
ncbi:MAG: M23 family metallopeptidase, partial [Pseudomonadota bacterium]